MLGREPHPGRTVGYSEILLQVPRTERIHEVGKHVVVCQLRVVSGQIEIRSFSRIVEVCHSCQVGQGRSVRRVRVVRENGK